MNTKRTLLIIEDDSEIAAMMSKQLKTQDYHTLHAKTAHEGLTLFQMDNPDLILLDLGLPDFDGFEVLKAIRRESQAPVIVISARFDASDKVKAFDLGADDYMTKPFIIDEFLARIRVQLRKLNTKVVYTSQISNGNMLVDMDSRSVLLNGIALNLTPSEYKLIETLSKNMGKVINYQTLLVEIWGHYGNSLEGLRVFVTTLRRKLEKADSQNKYIKTHIGVGYQMVNYNM